MEAENATAAGIALRRDSGPRALAWRFLPFFVFALLFAATFRRWVLPFEDSGREMHTAWRLARGEALYRDVGYSYGPLAPWVDAALLRAFGPSLGILVAWRTLLGLLGVEALRRLARRLAGDEAAASAATAFAVAACAFGIGGSWPFPYSVAALAGTVGTWWAVELALASGSRAASLAAALVATAAAGMKLEFVVGALVSLAAALVARRPRGEALAATALAAGVAGAAWAAPVALYGPALMRSRGFLIALSVPQSWRRVYERSAIFGGMSRDKFLSGGALEAVMPSALFVGALVLLLRTRAARRPAGAAALGVLAAIGTAASPRNAGLHVLLPLAIGAGLAAVAGWALRRFPRDTSEGEHAAAAVAMLPQVARQPIFLRNPVYGAFAAPLALVFVLSAAARRVAARTAFLAVVLGLCAGQVFLRVRGIALAPMTDTRLTGASVFLPAEESRVVTEIVGAIERRVPPGGSAAVFPEPGFVLFVTGRRNPFVDELFLPGVQDAAAEDEMIRRLVERPPDVLVLTDRAFPEFGGATYGHGLLDRFFAEASRRYVAVERLGGGVPMLRHAANAVVYVPRDR